MNIRDANSADLPAITEIYNEAIITTTATFDTAVKSLGEQEKWFAAHGTKYPVLVAEQDGVVIAWAAMSPWSDRCAYADTAEISLYVKEEYRGRGHGRKLSEAILLAGKQAGLHTAIARIAEGNNASIEMAELLGFEHVGVMKEVGRKFGQLLDVYIMQVMLK